MLGTYTRHSAYQVINHITDSLTLIPTLYNYCSPLTNL